MLYEKLKSLYYNAKFSGSLGGKNRFFREARLKIPTLKRKHVDEFLTSKDPYTLHAPVRRRFKRARIYVRGIAQLYQIDLADMQGLSEWNDNNRFLLTVIDAFSKYAWLVPIKNKTGETVADALKVLLTKIRKPQDIQSDKVTSLLLHLLLIIIIQFYSSREASLSTTT